LREKFQFNKSNYVTIKYKVTTYQWLMLNIIIIYFFLQLINLLVHEHH